MGRMHSHGKGIAKSAIPYRRRQPAWLKTSPDQVCDHICKLAKKGMTPSQIGVILRDSHGVGQISNVTGTKVLRILKANGRVLLFVLLFHFCLRALCSSVFCLLSSVLLHCGTWQRAVCVSE
jgi:Ribosomal S13/S15 N-terminal domain